MLLCVVLWWLNNLSLSAALVFSGVGCSFCLIQPFVVLLRRLELEKPVLLFLFWNPAWYILMNRCIGRREYELFTACLYTGNSSWSLILLIGRIGKISIKIPWKKLGWEPFVISLENVFLCASQRDDEEVISVFNIFLNVIGFDM